MPASSPPRVPANDFARQWEETAEDAQAAVERVGRSGWLILGEEVRSFEREFAEWWGVKHAVGVASGLDALEIGLRCAGIGRGDRVLTTPLSAFATTLAIVRAGAEPVWCDVEESGGLDLNAADGALQTDRSIRALLPVHLYGHPLDPSALQRLAHDRGVVLVEDCAQSLGAHREGRPSGTVGAVAATSLYPTKNLGALGDGGVLLSNDGAIAEHARRLRDYGQAARFEHLELGLNSRLDELQAAILRTALLPRVDAWLSRRSEIAARYAQGLDATAFRPVTARGGRSAHHLYPVEVIAGDPAQLATGLRARGVAVGRHYPSLCPDQPAVRELGRTVGPLSVARRLAANELSLPIHPYLDDEQVDLVIDACRDASE